MNKKNLIITGVVVCVLLFLFGWLKLTYNGFVEKEEAVVSAWAQVESDYQRRADLIPNLVNTVKGYAQHESQTLEAVTTARSQATQLTVRPEDLNEANIKKYQEAQGTVGAALGKLLAITENYPELKANENFKELQSQLEGCENRINVSRKDFNNAARDYNTSIRKFPGNMIASWFGFEQKPYFEAQQGAEKAPEVNF